jgi:GTPase SAR1 family protein
MPLFGLFGTRHRTVAIIGLPGHGKTVFLASLFWDSFFTLSRSFQEEKRKYNVYAETQKASDVFFGNAQTLSQGRLPPPNPRIKPEPATLKFTGVPVAGSRRRRDILLTFYDIAGEVFNSDQLTRENAPYLKMAHDIIFLFDPTRPDFNALMAGTLVQRVFRITRGDMRKNFILVLSKMDELRHQDEWAERLGRYWPDHPPMPRDLEAYCVQMDELSAHLRDWWTDGRHQAQAVINSLPTTTRFCAISSLGQTPTRDSSGALRLTGEPEPFRVRDPLFWVFRAAGVM